MELYSEITTPEALQKFIHAFYIPATETINKMPWQLNRLAGVQVGVVLGTISERFSHNEVITQQDIDDIVYDTQKNAIVSLPKIEEMQMSRFFATISALADEAFRIANSDEDLPPIDDRSCGPIP